MLAVLIVSAAIGVVALFLAPAILRTHHGHALTGLLGEAAREQAIARHAADIVREAERALE